MDMELTRRDLFKKAGILGAALALSGCGNQAEQRLVPFLEPPEQQVAGVFTYYASTCTECPAACGLLVKTMGGRAHKLEGNPRHPLNQGRLCARGQAGLQGLYNPDRIAGPQTRAGGRDGAWGTTTWDEGVTRLTEAVRKAASDGTRVAFLGGQVPDHLYKLVSLFSIAAAPLAPGGPSPTLPGVQGEQADLTVWNLGRAADGNVLLEQFAAGLGTPGVALPAGTLPLFDLAAADVVVSFAANFVETWLSPVNLSRQYGQMRRGASGRGYFAHVEPRLSLTATNADEWLPVAAGHEADVAMIMGKIILDERLASTAAPAGIEAFFSDVQPRAWADAIGLSFQGLVALARRFASAARPLALPGGGLAAYSNAPEAMTAVLALNLLVGAHESTLGLSVPPPAPELAPTERVSRYSAVAALVDDMRAGKVGVLINLDGDPLHDLPRALQFEAAAAGVPLIVDCSSFPTDTHAVADLLLPAPTGLETWGYHLPKPGTPLPIVGAQQPIIRALHDTRASADVLLAVAKGLGGEVGTALSWANEVEFLKQTAGVLAAQTPSSITTSVPEAFWERWQQFGGWWSTATPAPVRPTPAAPAAVDVRGTLKSEGDPAQRPFLLHVYPSLLLAEGRGANKPWLQEASDPMTSVMWESWVEVNPKVAERLGVGHGDVVTVSSNAGSVDVPVYVFPGIGEDVVAMPLGQGHRDYGRYARDRGVNPADLLVLARAGDSGELAFGATRVSLEKTGRTQRLPRLEGSDAMEVPAEF